MNLPRRLYNAEQTHQLEQIAIHDHDMPARVLMQSAGESAWRCLQERWPQARSVSVYCGSGNNGGDGYVLARLAHQAGLRVSLVYRQEPGTALAAEMKSLAIESGISCQPFAAEQPPESDIVVDAVFGSGLARAVEGPWADMLAAINQAAKPVLAIDIPSGLSADTGAVLGCAVQADLTITYITVNPGCLTGRGKQLTGQLVYDDLGVPSSLFDAMEPVAVRLLEADLRGLIPPRPADSHKGDFGRLLVVGGDHGYAGAIQMAGQAACRSGAGLVTVTTREYHAAAIAARVPELMVTACENAAVLKSLLAGSNTVLIGPGIGQGQWSVGMFAAVMDSEADQVIDADGLRLLSANPCRRKRRVLTPHPGEAAALLRCSTADVQADRLGAVRAIVDEYGGVCILKGAGTVIAEETGGRALCDLGNPGMSVPGMGDVLAGLVAGLLVQGLTPGDAARIAVWAHAAAADDAVESEGQIGMMATDVLPGCRRRINQLLVAD